VIIEEASAVPNGGTVRGFLQPVGYSLRSTQPTRSPCGHVATGARHCSAGLLAVILGCTIGTLAAHLIAPMSGKSIGLDRWLTYAGRAGQPGGKGWVRLSPRGVQEGQEVDPAQPPVPNLQHGMRVRPSAVAFCLRSVTR
jgi:hypothetical protein